MVETRVPTAGPSPIVNIPNALTIARLVLGFVVCALIAAGWFGPALWVFVVAALTDAVDGYVARALNQTSALGRQLDPLVDKILIIIVMIHLTPMVRSPLLPWVATIIVTREFVVQALRSLVEGRGVAFGARWSGKVKTAVQCSAVVVILTQLAFPGFPHIGLLQLVTLCAAGILTSYSGLVYLLEAWKILARPAPSAEGNR